jgi:hypothetical protein
MISRVSLDQFIRRGVKPSLNKAGFATYGSNSFFPENFKLFDGDVIGLNRRCAE